MWLRETENQVVKVFPPKLSNKICFANVCKCFLEKANDTTVNSWKPSQTLYLGSEMSSELNSYLSLKAFFHFISEEFANLGGFYIKASRSFKIYSRIGFWECEKEMPKNFAEFFHQKRGERRWKAIFLQSTIKTEKRLPARLNWNELRPRGLVRLVREWPSDPRASWVIWSQLRRFIPTRRPLITRYHQNLSSIATIYIDTIKERVKGNMRRWNRSSDKWNASSNWYIEGDVELNSKAFHWTHRQRDLIAARREPIPKKGGKSSTRSRRRNK